MFCLSFTHPCTNMLVRLLTCGRTPVWLSTNEQSRVAVLEDNQLSDTWAYLICCVTGWWINSGTTAKVFIYLKGTRGMVSHFPGAEGRGGTVSPSEWRGESPSWATKTRRGCSLAQSEWHGESPSSPSWTREDCSLAQSEWHGESPSWTREDCSLAQSEWHGESPSGTREDCSLDQSEWHGESPSGQRREETVAQSESNTSLLKANFPSSSVLLYMSTETVRTNLD